MIPVTVTLPLFFSVNGINFVPPCGTPPKSSVVGLAGTVARTPWSPVPVISILLGLSPGSGSLLLISIRVVTAAGLLGVNVSVNVAVLVAGSGCTVQLDVQSAVIVNCETSGVSARL